MSTITVNVEGLDRLQRQLGSMSRQMPFILSTAINDVAFKVRDEEQKVMRLKFDRVKSWTLRQMRIKKSRKTNLEAVIGSPQGIQGQVGPLDKILSPHIVGGARVTKKVEGWLRARGLLPAGYFAVPSRSTPIDNFGNIRKAFWKAIATWHGDKKLFVAMPGVRKTAHLHPGLYRRLGSRAGLPQVQTLLIYQTEARYTPRIDWARIAQYRAARDIPAAVRAAMDRALETAR